MPKEEFKPWCFFTSDRKWYYFRYDVIRAKKNKSVQMWSNLVSFDWKFDADENSYKKHGVEMISSRVMVSYSMSRDLSNS